MNRRDFLGSAAVGAAALTAAETLLTSEPAEAIPMSATKMPPVPRTERRGDMPYRALGKTGEMVSIIGLGGFHIGKQTEESSSIRIIHTAIDSGVNFMDNCWDYHDGLSELRMGKALAGSRRDKVFLMTKIDGRPKSVAAKQIDESLARLRTDRVDLLQFHEILRYEDPDRIFAPDGAIHAAIEAQKAGKVRFIGFTGHKNPSIHLEMFKVADSHGFHFDTVQHPVNVMDAHFRSFTRNVIPVSAAHGTATLGMKTFGDHFILDHVKKSGAASAVQLLHFGMSQPLSVLITGCDSLAVLSQALHAAKTFKPMTVAEQDALLAKTKVAASQGKYELFKTSERFDSTAQHPEWLGNMG
ncbi:aldo-keto reductase YhdN [Abditibacteriota bacterium]|nr:aldo-keto reductase YhdN [Abditibacteriota bacterium]